MGVAGISRGRCVALALLILVISVSAIIIIDSSDDSSAEKVYTNNIIYETIDEEKQMVVVGLLDKTVTDVYLPDTVTHNGVPYKVTTIKEDAFSAVYHRDYKNLRSIRLPEELLYIEDFAFYKCESLQSVTVSSAIVFIGEYAFADTGIKTVTIEGNFSTLPNNIFDGCTSLTSVKIPDSVETIGEYAFYNCTRLTEINVPNKLKELGDYAFGMCTSLNISSLSDSLTTIGTNIFFGCSSIEEFSLPSKVNYVSEYMFMGCSSLTKVTSTCNVIEIRSNAFNMCTNLTDIEFYKTVNTIGDRAFFGCNGIKHLEITSDVSSIGESAFGQCSGLRYITIPPTLKYMGDSIFESLTFYDKNGAVISDQSKLLGHSFEMINSKMTMLDGCYYSISYDVNGGTVPINSSIVDYDSTVEITQYEGVKDGYVFKGWSCEGKNYAVGDTFRMPGHSVEFTAIWDVYVSPVDHNQLMEEVIKFIAWACVSAVFVAAIVIVASYIIYRRRHW